VNAEVAGRGTPRGQEGSSPRGASFPWLGPETARVSSSSSRKLASWYHTTGTSATQSTQSNQCSVLRAVVTDQRSIATSQVSDSCGADVKPARFSQPSCMGPPQIGFSFDFREDTWEQSFEKLRLFVKANGGEPHVSTHDPERAELGNWCFTQVRRSSPARHLIGPCRCCTWTVPNPDGITTSPK